ncbi:hypothetical protein ADK93_05880 [Streptomyces sp. XY58]|nr:hypothetical protein ADK93_05880 [Streptomyces sp. XY58]KOV07997.1 hypothetical protein ADK89_08840 [Streptomyces sp. XY37]KOV53405.1 hypothetical protein ADK99_06130 [Streptomyces sp. MMG1064]
MGDQGGSQFQAQRRFRAGPRAGRGSAQHFDGLLGELQAATPAGDLTQHPQGAADHPRGSPRGIVVLPATGCGAQHLAYGREGFAGFLGGTGNGQHLHAVVRAVTYGGSHEGAATRPRGPAQQQQPPGARPGAPRLRGQQAECFRTFEKGRHHTLLAISS